MNRLIGLLALLSLLGAACQTTSAAKPPASRDPLALADSKLFSGDYDGAEAAYITLIDGGNQVAEAHYSVLLEYENRFTEAVTHARRASTTRPDSISLAHLTRALDWSEDVTGALEAGRRAVSGNPVDPLAHIFYAEALSDSAHFKAARAELQAGERAARDGYALAEVEREWSNYYRGKSDALEQLNHLQLALRLQPDFPERTLELARFRYLEKKPEAARALLLQLRKRHPNDYGVNVAAADSAFLQRDAATAETFFQAALRIRPNAPTASLGYAEFLVAGKRDFNAAHDLLLASLKQNPASADVYQYLRHLDLLVLKTDPDKELSPIQPTPPTAGGEASKQVLARVNSYRMSVGLAALPELSTLGQAAQAHAYFWLFNFGQPGVDNLHIHDEDPALPGAFGVNSSARAQHFGYTAIRTAEVISHVYLPAAAVDHWVDTVFHRYPITDREATGAGFGQAQVGAVSIQVLDLGLGDPSKQDMLVYPAPDQRDVPAAFLGGEIPDPVPTARYPTGYPITIQVGSSSTLTVTSAKLTGPDGRDLDGYVVQAATSPVTANQWAVVPQLPFQPAGKYTVAVTGLVDGQPFSRRWSFTVSAS